RKWFREVMARADSKSPGAVRYAGELDRRAKIELLDSIDVLCVPSVYAEPKGIYLLEAMARGVPVVAPAHGAFPELLEATAAGALRTAGDAQALAEALAGVLGDAPRCARLGNAGREAIRAHFTDDHMAARMLAVYRELLQPERASAYHHAGT